MDHVATIVAAPDRPALTAALAERLRRALRAVGAEVAEAAWLAPGAALDLAFAGAAPASAETAVRAALDGAPADVLCQPCAGRRKAVLVADMDSTIVTTETLDELAGVAGIKDRIAPITARAMNGEIDFAEALRQRVAMLAGLPEEALARVLAATEIMPGARALVRTMRAHGALTALVSGGFAHITGAVREAVGFDLDRSNRLEVAGGRLTGRVVEPILDRNAKLATLEELCRRQRVAAAAAAAVGDGANDLPMLLAAGLGVAFRAKPSVARAAAFRVEHADLTALLYAQGYRRDDIVP
ncbi:MAG: phosphoserine phosphatase SerB [Proteobacteria bacterium]|nr:phosphoserine phosphatase SerB [Pseudomonadota bacterium]